MEGKTTDGMETFSIEVGYIYGTSGHVTELQTGATTDYTFSLPTSIGTSGQVLTSDGVGQTFWSAGGGSGVTSVGIDVPSVFTVSNSPITGSGVMQIAYSGVPLPIANGGTGVNSIGVNGTVLTSDGTAMYWSSLGTGTVTSVAASVPSFLSISGSPVTGSGTLAFGLSGTALPVTSGGTGLTAVGGNGTVLSSNGTVLSWQTAALGSVTSVAASVPSFLSISGSPITGSGTLAFGLSGTALPVTSGGTGLTALGGNGTVLSSNGSVLSWQTAAIGSVTSVAASVPSFLSISGSPVTTSGTLAIGLSGTALPVANGGTGLTALGGNGTVLSSNGSVLSWQTAALGSVTSVAASVPSFLSISGSPVTTSGTLAIGLSGTALPVANGGTGVTTSTGSGSNVLSTSPTLVTPVLGAATGTSLSLSSLTATQTVFTDGSKNLVSITIPKFRAVLTSNQSITTGSTAIICNSVIYNLGSFLSTVDGKFTPTVAGYYQFNMSCTQVSSTGGWFVKIGKNGTAICQQNLTSSQLYATTSASCFLNGSTDYVTAIIETPSSATVLGDSITSFSGFFFSY